MFRIDVADLKSIDIFSLRPAVCAWRSFRRQIPGPGTATKKEAKKAGTSYSMIHTASEGSNSCGSNWFHSSLETTNAGFCISAGVVVLKYR